MPSPEYVGLQCPVRRFGGAVRVEYLRGTLLSSMEYYKVLFSRFDLGDIFGFKDVWLKFFNRSV